MRLVAPVVLGLLILLSSAREADARTALFSVDEQITYLAPLPDELVDVRADGFDKVGFYFKRFALLDANIWTWSGTVVFYRAPELEFTGFRTIETTWYVEVDEEMADRYGWSAPVRYHIPVGLLVLLCMVELVLVAMKKRRAKLVLAIGIGLVVASGVLYLIGLTWEFAIPLVLGVFHIVSALYHPATNSEILAADREHVEDSDIPRAPPPPPPDRPSERLLPPAPSFEKDPFRAPPQPPPIHVKRPPTTPAAAPVVRDDSADGPKLLR